MGKERFAPRRGPSTRAIAYADAAPFAICHAPCTGGTGTRRCRRQQSVSAATPGRQNRPRAASRWRRAVGQHMSLPEGRYVCSCTNRTYCACRQACTVPGQAVFTTTPRRCGCGRPRPRDGEGEGEGEAPDSHSPCRMRRARRTAAVKKDAAGSIDDSGATLTLAAARSGVTTVGPTTVASGASEAQSSAGELGSMCSSPPSWSATACEMVLVRAGTCSTRWFPFGIAPSGRKSRKSSPVLQRQSARCAEIVSATDS